MNVCFGLLVVFFCETQQPAAVDGFCRQAAPEVAKLRRLSEAEIAALQRPRKEAILSLRRKYDRLCAGK